LGVLARVLPGSRRAILAAKAVTDEYRKQDATNILGMLKSGSVSITL